ncbi:MAG TPA: 4-hydroxybenzoyl-CoA reductase subunit beta [Deltaproteobacteria bacterium]|nr:4-hydroxybenzoyl-CoA reductase subunit beta [Deltaproteobacteria bacterium]
MLRMPEFEVHHPTTPEEAVALRAELPGSMYVAGGTDLLPNLKHRLHEPPHLIALSRLSGLDRIEQDPDGSLILGASTPLAALAGSELLAASVPGLVEAAASIAGPQHRRMGTLGGNVMLDTRCLFYNQSRPWRQAVGGCLKKDGDWCHVIGSAKACVAAQSSDTVPMLVALDARLRALLPGGERRELPLLELFSRDGRFEQRHTLPPEALITHVHVPSPGAGHRSTYRKVRARSAVDYPQLSIALAATLEGERCTALQVVIGAMLPQPRPVPGLHALIGEALTDEVCEAIAEKAYKAARPQPQLHGEPSWRRHLCRIETRRGLQQLRSGPQPR